MGNTVLILVNHDLVIYNFRKELVEALLRDGYEVIISSPYGERIDKLIEMGCKYEEIDIDRHGFNPLKEMRLLLKYRSLIKRIKPSIVLSYTIKPNIYGGIASTQLGVPYIANITGLGNALVSEGFKSKLLISLYSLALKKVNTVYFQNQSNLDYLTNVVNIGNKVRLIPGSGVNINEFAFKEYEQNRTINILYIGRIMYSKGIDELLEAIDMIHEHKEYEHLRFQFLGFFEEESLRQRFNELSSVSSIEFYEHQLDIKIFIESAQAIILPSHHEGMSNSLLEAASTGRPLLASNIPGCKEIVDDGVNGFLFEPKDSVSIYESVKKFVSLSFEERQEMGRQSRLKVEREFDRNIVVNEYLKNIREILEG